jgi:hypothetical protein
MKDFFNKVTTVFFTRPVDEKLGMINFDERFISLSINKNITDSITMNRIIQLEDKEGCLSQSVLFKEKGETNFKYYKKNKLISFSKLENNTINQNYVHKLTELFDFSIKKSQELLRKPSEVTSDISNESKGLEWIKVSLVVLKSAINKSIDDPELTFDGQFFYGQRRNEDHTQLRVQCLSLDFLLDFYNDGRLRVTVWNYRDLEPDSKSDPAFIAEFVKVKQHVFDEFIQLLVLMSRAATKIK